jgi:eukaryotic-like serine/threonine-protein kinase
VLPVVDTTREIIENPGQDDAACRRMLLLPMRYRVVVEAVYEDRRTPAPCTIADAVFTAAKTRLGTEPLPRRDNALDPSLRSGSLAAHNACGFFVTADLSGLLGVDTAPEPGFANWSCAWFDPGRNRRVLVAFDRIDPPVPEDATPVEIAGRDGYVQPEGWGPRECLVAVRFGEYDSTDQDARKVEELRVFVRDDQPPAQRCESAKTLADTAARQLS